MQTTIVVAILVAALVVVVCGLGLLGLASREWKLRSRMYDLFAVAMDAEWMLDSMGIEADWVALKLCGFPPDEKIRSLPGEAQAKAIELSEAVSKLGAKLVAAEELRYFDVTFENQGKNQIVKSPKSLFMLAPKGKAEVLRRRAKMGLEIKRRGN